MSGSDQHIAGAQVTGDLDNVVETGAEVVGDVLTVTSTAPLTAAWQAGGGGAALPVVVGPQANGTLLTWDAGLGQWVGNPNGVKLRSVVPERIFLPGPNGEINFGSSALEGSTDARIAYAGANLLQAVSTSIEQNGTVGKVEWGTGFGLFAANSIGSSGGGFYVGQAGDAERRTRVASGLIEFGNGTNPVDTFLTRAGVALLYTPGSIGIDGNAIFTAASYLEFGGDTYVQRYAAALLNFPGTALRVEGFRPAQFSENAAINCIAGGVHATPGAAASGAFAAGQSGDTNPRTVIRADGRIEFGDGTFGPTTYPGAYLKWKDAGRLEVSERLNALWGFDCISPSATDCFRSALAADPVNAIRFAISTDGQQRWGTGASSAGDNIIARIAAGFLRQTEGQFKHPLNRTGFSGPGTLAMQDWDTVALIDTNAGAATVNLPTTVKDGDEVVIKDSGGFAGTNAITIDPGANQIDGVAGTIQITANNGALRLMTDGVDWWIIGAYL